MRTSQFIRSPWSGESRIACWHWESWSGRATVCHQERIYETVWHHGKEDICIEDDGHCIVWTIKQQHIYLLSVVTALAQTHKETLLWPVYCSQYWHCDKWTFLCLPGEIENSSPRCCHGLLYITERCVNFTTHWLEQVFLTNGRPSNSSSVNSFLLVLLLHLFLTKDQWLLHYYTEGAWNRKKAACGSVTKCTCFIVNAQASIVMVFLSVCVWLL